MKDISFLTGIRNETIKNNLIINYQFALDNLFKKIMDLLRSGTII